ncbi:hypothetical protein IU438_17950 [Nocardia cyriacigeorgica]|jgi:hypothetical protein|uniref:hypothetical protein n=1 Tax=Nocardia cyriacigeorgica TaxID=135487 RepID=UPI0003056361|nr:hypothetical protein [Nocardia cyriacigeorgica]AVH20590.1 hypothetical protein C5B73_02985 [Nocardia cyriacigeorgica]MBF6086985.1 hypothetical protein [Nocardia cyriacigeorgica]MBF6093078.1 hypothetical protein [Nocardia cyriacigeorgica]MBF6325096.1 hypothetical protein [Nocardia cyriacigeorgica]MBF6397674.1 hypothetical protein [Nocardia cyriacigeorgica]
MTAAHHYDDLHRLVDRLTPDQARALRAVALQLVVTDASERESAAEPGGERRRRLSFAGLMRAEPDLAARSEDLLREERGKQAP